jgi:hypothetical protein
VTDLDIIVDVPRHKGGRAAIFGLQGARGAPVSLSYWCARSASRARGRRMADHDRTVNSRPWNSVPRVELILCSLWFIITNGTRALIVEDELPIREIIVEAFT